MLTLYDYLPSQNAYKIRLLLNHLQQPHKTEIISIFEGSGQNDIYHAINPTGAVPAIKLDDGRTLAESNAILTYLAQDSAYLPADQYKRAKVMQWLFFEGDYVQAGIATLRYWILTGKDKKRSQGLLETKKKLCLQTLTILDAELSKNSFLGGAEYTIADMSVFAYVHLAGDANLPLSEYKSVTHWIERVRRQSGFLTKTYDYSIDPYSSEEL